MNDAIKWGYVLVAVSWVGLCAGCGAGCRSCASDGPPEKKTPVVAPQQQTPVPSAVPLPELVAVGRALELGRTDEAARMLAGRENESQEAAFLTALIAERSKRDDQLIDIILKTTFTRMELATRAGDMLLDALARTGQYEAIHDRTGALLAADPDPVSRRRLLERDGDALLALGRFDEARQRFSEAAQQAGGAAEALKVKESRALIGAGYLSRAEKILLPLALSAARATIMKDAFSLLEANSRPPRWTGAQRLERIATLTALKSWDEAAASIRSLQQGATGGLAKELRWRMANLLFERRRHYNEALVALEEVIRDGAPYADRAAFLRAQTLSRLDRDEEAIVAYREWGRTTADRGRVDEALFYAARLAFYLGRHGEALSALRAIVGDGTGKTKKGSLSADTARDAHFLAGMSAFLEKNYSGAQVHFTAASKGSSVEEAVERNTYWAAVSALEQNPSAGAPSLRALCDADPTSWYAFFAAIRLAEKGEETGDCPLLPSNDSGDASGAVEEVIAGPEKPSLPLEEISDAAALFARMGLFREAAKALSDTEKAGRVQLSDRDWVLHYNTLDAPQYAIRRASAPFSWDKKDAEPWRARASYPIPFAGLVRAEEERHGLPPFLIFAIARKESLFDPFARSSVGAMGLMQMMPATWEANRKKAGLPALENGRFPDPAESIVAGGFELAHLLEKYHGVLPLAIMAYNGGGAAVDRWVARSGSFPMDVFVEKGGFAQTRNYVRRVYAILYRYRMLYGAPPPSLPRDLSAHLSALTKSAFR